MKYIVPYIFILMILCLDICNGIGKQVDNFNNDDLRSDSILRIDSLLNRAKNLWYEDPEKSIDIAIKAYEISLLLDQKVKQAQALNLIGSGYYFLSEIDSSILYFERSLHLSKSINFTDGISRTTNNLGIIYDYMGKYDMAVDFYFQSLEIEKDNNNLEGIATAYLNIGNVYYTLKDFNRALEYMTNSLRFWEELDNKEGILNCNTNLGLIYLETNYLEIALNYAQKALDLSKTLENPDLESANLNNIGTIYFRKENYPKALEYYNSALSIEREYNDKWSQANTLRNIGRLYAATGEFENANSFFESALILAGEINSKTILSELYYDFYQLFEKQNRFEEALFYHKAYIQIKDSLFNIKSRENIARVESLFNLESSNKQLEVIRNENLEKQLKIKNQRYIIYSVASFSLFVFLLGFFFYYRSVSNKRARIKLENKNREISSQKSLLEQTNSELQESREKYKALSESVQDGLVIIQDKKLIYANDIMLSITGYRSLDELKKLSPEDIISKEDFERVMGNYEKRLKGHILPKKYNFCIKHKSGKPIEISFNIKVIRLHGKPALIGTIKDISKSKQYEQNLIEEKERAETATSSKSLFLAGMSHEIRNHMSSIIGITEVLSDAELTEEQSEYVEIIQNSGYRLLNLLNEILDLSKIEAGQVQLEETETNLKEIIDEVIALHEVNAKQQNLYLKKELPEDLPDRIITDSNRLNQIIINLVSNGLKFTNQGGVRVKCEILEKRKKSVRIRFNIIDTGKGIREKDIPLLFKPFSQVSLPRQKKGNGTGLGLVICKNLIQIMKGEIGVESTYGKGSNFWFTINFKIADRSLKKSKSTGTKDKYNKVLIVEDNILNQQLTKTVLEKEKIYPDIASNGKEGLKLYKKNHYDVILMDLQMPVMDGLEATRRIREYENKNHDSRSTIIAITAHAKENDIQSLKAAGMDDILEKPFNPDILTRMIKESFISLSSP